MVLAFKSEEGLLSAAVMGVERETVSLPLVSTIFTAEVIALRLAMKLGKKRHIVRCSLYQLVLDISLFLYVEGSILILWI